MQLAERGAIAVENAVVAAVVRNSRRFIYLSAVKTYVTMT